MPIIIVKSESKLASRCCCILILITTFSPNISGTYPWPRHGAPCVRPAELASQSNTRFKFYLRVDKIYMVLLI